MCHVVGLPELKLYSGFDVGSLSGGLLSCRQATLPDYLDIVIDNGKAALKVLEWVAGLEP